MGVRDRIAHAWNAFRGDSNSSQDTYQAQQVQTVGPGYSYKPDRVRMRYSNERSIIASLYTRLAVDASGVKLKHVKLDDNGMLASIMPSGLNNCLTVEANLDQGARAFSIDMWMTLFDEGTIAIVPVDTTLDPNITGSYDINSLRVGRIVQWYAQHVRVSVYNEKTGKREEIVLSKKFVAIVENPFFSVMNEQNSTLQRLIRKLNLLDAIDEQSGSGKLDIIIQLPYTIRSETRQAQAEKRRKDLEVQMSNSKYGIGYTDATEKITQLNRPAENNIMSQVEYLTNMLYGQLGLTPAIFDGSASEAAMLNYYSRTIEPLLDAVKEAINRTFLTKTARSQKQSVEYYRDAFKLVPISQLGDIADKFTRNKILTSNEIRGIVGFAPIDDPSANMLDNPNMPNPVAAGASPSASGPPQDGSNADQIMNDTLNALKDNVTSILAA